MPLTLFACITFAIVSFPHVGENTFATATFALCISAIVIGLFRQIYINIVRKHYRVYFQYLSKKLSLIPLVIYTCIGCTLLYGQYLSPEARRTNIDKYLMTIEAQGSIFDECQFMIPLYLKNQLNSIGQSPRPIKGRGLQLTHEVLASYKSMLLHCALQITHTRGTACLWSHRRDIDKARFFISARMYRAETDLVLFTWSEPWIGISGHIHRSKCVYVHCTDTVIV